MEGSTVLNNISNNKIDTLISIVEKLRSKEGCPWDKKQTHESILPCIIEEAYELIDAVHLHDNENMKEELGDILLQVLFHSQIAKEENTFTFMEVVQSLSEKLIRRHPHVFASKKVSSVDDVLQLWDQIKSNEKDPTINIKLSETIPKGLPPLQKAEKIQKKVKKMKFDWPDCTGPLEKVKEELAEFINEVKGGRKGKISPKHMEEEFGDLLFSLVNLARHLGLSPSGALEKTNLKFMKRFEKMMDLMEKDGKKALENSLVEMDVYWEKAKRLCNS